MATWHEAKTPSGQVYFYDPVTRATSWQRPMERISETSSWTSSASASDRNEVASSSSIKILDSAPDPSAPYRASTSCTVNHNKLDHDSIASTISATQEAVNATWTEVLTPDGQRRYYVNKKTCETTWLRPKVGNVVNLPTEFTVNKQCRDMDVPSTKGKYPVIMDLSEVKEKSEPRAARKISAETIDGSHFKLVRMSDGRKFYYDTKEKVSSWTVPIELQEILDKLQYEANERMAAELNEMFSDDESEDDGDEGVDEPEIVEDDCVTTSKRPCNMDYEEYRAKRSRLESATPEKIPPCEEIQRDQAVTEFKELLASSGVSAFGLWDQELLKIQRDARFLCVAERERKSTFEDWCAERAEIAKEEKRIARAKTREDFKIMLSECKSRLGSFMDVATKLSRDKRFKGVLLPKERQTLFNEWRAENKASKEVKLRDDFFSLLREERIHVSDIWTRIKRYLSGDRRFEAVEARLQEKWFDEYVAELASKNIIDNVDQKTNEDEERRLRSERAMEERERSVRRNKAETLRIAERERSLLAVSEGRQLFEQLLIDVIKRDDMSWEQCRASLQKDERWNEATRAIHHDEREVIFRNHIAVLSNRKIAAFHTFLRSLNLDLTAEWSEVEPLTAESSATDAITLSSRSQEFLRFQKEAKVTALRDFHSQLVESPMLTYKTRDDIDNGATSMNDVHLLLSSDRRFLVLDPLAEERQTVLEEYLDNLKAAGPPPPPTASRK